MKYRYVLLHRSNQHLTDHKVGRKLRCPSCGQKRFVPYVDLREGGLADPNRFGRCERIESCQYHCAPTQKKQQPEIQKIKIKPMIQIPHEFVEKSAMREPSTFERWVAETFPEIGAKVTRNFRLGTSNKPWAGATVFWQIDRKGVVRAGKIMDYEIKDNQPRRVKNPRPRMHWVHSLAGISGELHQCLFGLHLINDDTDTVYVVESEKTAIIASCVYPELCLVATGGMKNLKNLLLPLSQKTTRLLPDVGAERDWQSVADECRHFMIDCEVLKWWDGFNCEDGEDIADAILEGFLPSLEFRPEKKKHPKHPQTDPKPPSKT